VPFTQEVIHLKYVDIHLIHFDAFDPLIYLDQLTEGEQERFFTFHHIKRKCEYVATRILRHRLFGHQHIHYDTHGAPFIENEGFISISHAGNVVGLAVSKKFKLGLDLEYIRNKAYILRSKFLSEHEAKNLDTNSMTEMAKVWSIKEVMYKLAGRKKIIFKKELLIKKVSDDFWTGTIINPNEKIHVQVNSFIHKDIIISVNHLACNYEKYDL